MADSSPDNRSSEELAVAASGGSSDCFDVLVDRLGPRLLRYLRRKVGDAHTAEDLVQETFLKAYRNLGRYDPSRSFSTWLFTIATRLAISHARSRRPAPAMGEYDPVDTGRSDPADTVARAEQHRGLWARAARVLGGDQYSALWLRYAEEMSVRDIAGVMGKTRSGVKVLLHRARRCLMEVAAPAAAAAPPAPAPVAHEECVVRN